MTAVIIAFTAWEPDVFICLKEVPIWPLTAGVMGAALVFGIAWVMPPTGAAKGFGLLIVGQVITGLTLSTSGTGSPVKHVSLSKILGALLLVTGVGMVTFAK